MFHGCVSAYVHMFLKLSWVFLLRLSSLRDTCCLWRSRDFWLLPCSEFSHALSTAGQLCPPHKHSHRSLLPLLLYLTDKCSALTPARVESSWKQSRKTHHLSVCVSVGCLAVGQIIQELASGIKLSSPSREINGSELLSKQPTATHWLIFISGRNL